MESFIKKNNLNMMPLKKIDIGTQGYFEFSADVERFGFIESLNNIVITPILHRNMNKFMGIKATNDYICYKVIKDKFLAMTIKGEISCWNVLTGKLLSVNKAEGHDYSNFDLHSVYKKGAVFLKSKEKVENCRE